MMIRALFTVAVIFATSVSADWEEYVRLMTALGENKKITELWDKYQEHLDGELQGGVSTFAVRQWGCEIPASSEVPTSVHKLLPGDIKVIGALGDSITAANGANTTGIARVLLEYRGYSFSAGGVRDLESGVTTLPNILKKYSDDLFGYATGTGKATNKVAGFNVAVAGSVSEDLGKQAQDLVKKLKASAEVDMEKDWKVVSLLIGGNDLCKQCNDKTRYSPENYVKGIQEALDILHEHLPRTFVNLISIFDITPVANLGKHIACKLVHRALCDCGKKASNQEMNVALFKAYSKGAEDLAASGRYDTREDFTVVFQPFLKDTPVPSMADGKPDFTYMAPDCFHWSGKGHAAASIMLWNGMFEPVGQKTSKHDFTNITPYCPPQGKFFATAGNS